MKTRPIFKTSDSRIRVSIFEEEEVRYIRRIWQGSRHELPVGRRFAVVRATLLEGLERNDGVQLFSPEIEWLYQYWVRRDFNEGRNATIENRLEYLSRLIGKRKAKLMYNRITKKMHEQNLREDEDAEDVPFPAFWSDSDFAGNN